LDHEQKSLEISMSENETSSLDESTVPFYPDHIGLEAKVALVFGVFVIIVGLAGMVWPVGLQEPADPMNTPAHVKPEWYFLALYQLLKYIPKGIGAAAPVILIGIILIWPFFDRKPDKSKKNTRNRGLAMLIIMLVLMALTLWGDVS
jgi:quinol-cytochrome oxidoreductase complex cytochrome b subunit